jgi:hypothetical protein
MHCEGPCCTHTRIYRSVHTCTYKHTLYMYTHTHTHTHTYTHTHTHMHVYTVCAGILDEQTAQGPFKQDLMRVLSASPVLTGRISITYIILIVACVCLSVCVSVCLCVSMSGCPCVHAQNTIIPCICVAWRWFCSRNEHFWIPAISFSFATRGTRL